MAQGKAHSVDGRAGGSALAKVSTPRVDDWLPRQRLFRWLDEARGRYRLVWIAASPGSGKTYLVASYLAERRLPALWYQVDGSDGDVASFVYYLGVAATQATGYSGFLPVLTPEYRSGLRAFARNFFRELFARLETPGLVVLDNFQDAPADSPVHELLEVAASEVPAGLTLVVLSRGEPPPSLARWRIHGDVGNLRDRDLRVRRNEIRALARRYRVKDLDAGQLRALSAESHGWFAGVVLLLAQLRDSGSVLTGHDERDREVIFDYFASELFDRAPASDREFLMKTAFLSPVYAAAARELTGMEDSGDRLEWLVRNHYFMVTVSGSPVRYRYHPLFERFLRSRARQEWHAQRLAEVCRRAADLAVAAEHIDDAVGLLREIGDRDALADLLVRQAPIMLAQGRDDSLRAWLGDLPREVVARNPWLDYWIGMAMMFHAPAEARESLVNAFDRFRTGGDVVGQYRAWIAVVESLLLGLDDFRSLDGWLNTFDSLRQRHPDWPTTDIECAATVAVFCARIHRCDRYDDVGEWGDRALALARASGNRSLLVQVLFFRGFHDLVLRVPESVDGILDELERMERSHALRPMDLLRIRLLFAIYHNCSLDHAACRAAVDDGMAIADESGVYVLNLMLLGQLGWQAVQLGDACATDQALERMDTYLGGASPWDHALYLNIAGARAQLDGDLECAAERQRRNLAELERLGEAISTNLGRLQLATVLVVQRNATEGLTLIEKVERFAQAKGATRLLQHCYLLRALSALNLGDDDAARHYLRHGDFLESGFGRYGFLIWPPGALADLCERALRRDVEPGAIRTLIRAYDLLPSGTATDLENWPRPTMIYTLGRFVVVQGGQTIRFEGKAQKRPLELLRALVALGGRGVSIELLCEALWPDAEGDAAAQRLKPTLHRLRRLIGDAAVLLSEGRLSLDPQRCWVDVWALERRLGALKTLLDDRHSDMNACEAQILDALNLYQGPFLGLEPDAPWLLSTRERIRNRLVAVITDAARRFAQEGDCQRVQELCEHGLMVDDLSEQLYRGLMGCQAANGNRGMALRTYERCREILAAKLATMPDPATEIMRHAILERSQVTPEALCPVCGQHQV